MSCSCSSPSTLAEPLDLFPTFMPFFAFGLDLSVIVLSVALDLELSIGDWWAHSGFIMKTTPPLSDLTSSQWFSRRTRVLWAPLLFMTNGWQGHFAADVRSLFAIVLHAQKMAFPNLSLSFPALAFFLSTLPKWYHSLRGNEISDFLKTEPLTVTYSHTLNNAKYLHQLLFTAERVLSWRQRAVLVYGHKQRYLENNLTLFLDTFYCCFS